MYKSNDNVFSAVCGALIVPILEGMSFLSKPLQKVNCACDYSKWKQLPIGDGKEISNQ